MGLEIATAVRRAVGLDQGDYWRVLWMLQPAVELSSAPFKGNVSAIRDEKIMTLPTAH